MSNSKRSRRHFTTEQNVAFLRRHLVDKIPVSDLCNEEELQPSVVYQRQRQLFENLAAAFTTPASEGPSKREKLERYHKTIKSDAIRPGQACLARRGPCLVAGFVHPYNAVRLPSAVATRVIGISRSVAIPVPGIPVKS